MKVEQNAALVIFSGGQDSTTCLYWSLRNFKKVSAISFNYGQLHKCEIEAARNIFDRAISSSCVAGYDMAQVIEHAVINVGPILTGSSPLISGNALEQYQDMNSLPGGLEKTFVPGRNLLFLTLAANFAYSRGIPNLVTGVCQEDYGGYPDCRQTFIDAVQQAIRTGFGYDDNDPFSKMVIHTPLMNLSKAESVIMAHEMPDCWRSLALTHTSYDGKYPPTGNDHATLLRAKGFFEAGLPDPLVVRAAMDGLMPIPSTSNYDSIRSNKQ